MAERLWQTDSINQAAAKRERRCECGNVTQSLTGFFVMGAVHMIMESIKSLWCWTFYRQIRRMHPPIKEKPSFVKKKKSFAVPKIQFDWCRDESGMEMCSLESASYQQHGLQSCRLLL